MHHAIVSASLALLAAAPAFASGPGKAPAHFCRPAAQIASVVKDCSDNDAYIDQGEDCLDELDAEVKKATGAMTSAFSADAKAQQVAKFGSAVQDYAQSSATLAYLISLNELAIREMDGYLDSLEAPEDADEPDVTGGDPQKYSMSVACYGETTRSLRGIQEDFGDRLRQLRAAKGEADAALAAARGSGKGLGGSEGQAVTNGVGRGAGTSAGHSAPTAPDITGVRQDQWKQSQ